MRPGIALVRERPDVSVLIAGGGINGVGLLRELALQGVDALLVDKSDFCAGTSGAMTRIIHGASATWRTRNSAWCGNPSANGTGC